MQKYLCYFNAEKRLSWLGYASRMPDGRIPIDILYVQLAKGVRPKGQRGFRTTDMNESMWRKQLDGKACAGTKKKRAAVSANPKTAAFTNCGKLRHYLIGLICYTRLKRKLKPVTHLGASNIFRNTSSYIHIQTLLTIVLLVIFSSVCIATRPGVPVGTEVYRSAVFRVVPSWQQNTHQEGNEGQAEHEGSRNQQTQVLRHFLNVNLPHR